MSQGTRRQAWHTVGDALIVAAIAAAFMAYLPIELIVAAVVISMPIAVGASAYEWRLPFGQ